MPFDYYDHSTNLLLCHFLLYFGIVFVYTHAHAHACFFLFCGREVYLMSEPSCMLRLSWQLLTAAKLTHDVPNCRGVAMPRCKLLRFIRTYVCIYVAYVAVYWDGESTNKLP